MNIQQIKVKCTACGKESWTECVVNSPLDVFLASMRTARCRYCGANYSKLLLVYTGGDFMNLPPQVEK